MGCTSTWRACPDYSAARRQDKRERANLLALAPITSRAGSRRMTPAVLTWSTDGVLSYCRG